jgi:hypothetical protein
MRISIFHFGVVHPYEFMGPNTIGANLVERHRPDTRKKLCHCIRQLHVAFLQQTNPKAFAVF